MIISQFPCSQLKKPGMKWIASFTLICSTMKDISLLYMHACKRIFI